MKKLNNYYQQLNDDEYYYFLELEKYHKESLRYLNNEIDLLKCFPEVTAIDLHEKLNEWTSLKGFYDRQIEDLFSKNVAKKEVKIIVELATLPIADEYNNIASNIRRLKTLISYLKNKSNTAVTNNFQERIASIKQTPIQNIIERFTPIRNIGSHFICNCPLHNEKTSSFHIYPTNTFYCFGCHKGGDVINFIKYMFGYNTKEAINYLTNY